MFMNKHFGETKRNIKGEGWRNRVMTTDVNICVVIHAKELSLLVYIMIILWPQTGVSWAWCSSCFEMSFLATCDLPNVYLKSKEIITTFLWVGLTHLGTSDHVRDSGQLWRVYVNLRLIWYILSVVCQYICISFYSYINQPFVIVWKTSQYTFLFLQRSVHCSVSAFCRGNVFLFRRKYLFI